VRKTLFPSLLSSIYRLNDDRQLIVLLNFLNHAAVATGGFMHGCANGHWVMGTSHRSANLPSTVAFGVFNASLYAESAAPKIRLDLRVTTPAECVTVVRKMFPDANAAELSNTGEVWCDAVFNVTGVIYEPLKQVCIFDDSWRTERGDRRRLTHSEAQPTTTCIECGTAEQSSTLIEEVAGLKKQLAQNHHETAELKEQIDKIQKLLKHEQR
jgi:hypothetical protein